MKQKHEVRPKSNIAALTLATRVIEQARAEFESLAAKSPSQVVAWFSSTRGEKIATLLHEQELVSEGENWPFAELVKGTTNGRMTDEEYATYLAGHDPNNFQQFHDRELEQTGPAMIDIENFDFTVDVQALKITSDTTVDPERQKLRRKTRTS